MFYLFLFFYFLPPPSFRGRGQRAVSRHRAVRSRRTPGRQKQLSPGFQSMRQTLCDCARMSKYQANSIFTWGTVAI